MSARSQLRERVTGRRTVIDDQIIDLRDHVAKPGLSPQSAFDLGKQAQLREVKVFGSPAFRRLWFSQVASSMGDWIGLVAITAIVGSIGANAGAALGGVSLVLAARLVPGFFFSPVAGVMIDRFDRKRVMVLCDFGRAVVLCCLPFVHNLAGFFIASLILELLTLMWSTAKEASVPNLVKPEFLPSANSLSVAAAYGPLLVAGGIFSFLTKVPGWLHDAGLTGANDLTKTQIALYFDAFTYLVSAAVIATLTIRKTHHSHRPDDQNAAEAGLKLAREGLTYVAKNARIRSVMLGLATGLIGGAMVVPLGINFADVVLGAGEAGYGLLLTGLGAGVAIGVLVLTVLQKHLPIEKTFMLAVLGAGASLLAAASVNNLAAAVACTGALGICAGAVYVLGYTSIQMNTVDEMRGRVFATLYTVTRLCILLALVIAPLLAVALGNLSDRIFDGSVHLLGATVALPGVRLTFWLGGIIVVVAGLLASLSLRRGLRTPV